MQSSYGVSGADLARGHEKRGSRWPAFLAAAMVFLASSFAKAAESEEGAEARLTADAAPAPTFATIVTAEPDQAPAEDSAAAASVVTRDRTPRSGESLPQVLSELPGVSVTRLGGHGTLALVSLRGSTWEQVHVYLDGIPLNVATGGGVDLSTIPLGAVERIEVYRGMSPIAFGTSAIGGIVSITTSVPRRDALEAEAGMGSFGLFSGAGRGSWASGPLRVLGGAEFLTSSGDFTYRADNGTSFDTTDDRQVTRSNNALTQLNGLARLALDLPGDREISTAFLVFHRNQGLPGMAIYPTRTVSLGTLRGVASIAYKTRGGMLGPGGRLKAQLYTMLVEQALHDPKSEIASGPTDTRDKTWAIGATLRLSRRLSSWLRLAAIVDGRHESFRPRDNLATSQGAPSSRLFAAIGGEAHVRVLPLRLEVVPSLRLEAARDVRSGRDLFGDQLPASDPLTRILPIARLALLRPILDGAFVRANLGRYARLPTSTELYGNTGFLLGNPDLAPEWGLSADAGVSARFARANLVATLDASLFGTKVSDLIYFQQNAYGVARAANIGSARVLGAETSASAVFGRHGRLFFQATFTDARDTSDSTASRDRQLPLRPRLRAYVRPEARHIPLGWRDMTLGLHVELDATSGNYVDAANLVAMPRRILLGAGASLEAAGGRVRLIASAQNLGDSRVSDVAGFPLPGRSAFLSLIVTTPREKEHMP
ncbi:MAG: TonB-dependent receptor [Deltaproteobacteria bacterium]|nr:TonB-dependent receptor [Deltaproteobacteria bacterium]